MRAKASFGVAASGNAPTDLEFRSLTRTFDFAEIVLSLGNETKNFCFCFAFRSLIRTFAAEFARTGQWTARKSGYWA